MTADQQIELAGIIASAIQSLFWPIVIIFIFIYFGEPLKRFLGNLGELTFKAAGVEATAKKQQAEAATALFPDVENRIRANLESEALIRELKEIVSRENGKRTEGEVSEFLAAVADKTIETIRQENFISVDSRPLAGSSGHVWELPYSQFASVSEFLDNIWFLLRIYDIPSVAYGNKWLLRNTETGKKYQNMGRSWAKKFGKSLDTRSLTDVGIMPGMKLEIISP